MSRKRQDRRKKRAEMERQLGDDAGAVDPHALQERERVTRPELQLTDTQGPGGVRGLLAGRAPAVVVALFVVEARGARLHDVREIGPRKETWDKLSYTRPAHFVAVAVAARDADDACARLRDAAGDLRVDDEELTSPAFASDEWETPRAARLTGVPGYAEGAAVSVRGVGRSALAMTLPLGRWRATVDLKL